MSPAHLAWESLSNSMRLYAESGARFKSLFRVDSEEAVSNHDRAFDAKMEAFHRLYDITRSLPGFAYFAHGDTSLLIVLRNAVHHCDHNLFTSWNSMLSLRDGLREKSGATFLLSSYKGFPRTTSKYFLPLHDFYTRLCHPSIKSSDALRDMWERELSFAAIAERGRDERYPNDQVYVDVVPVFISAMQRVTSWMQLAGLAPIGFDGRTYANHFSAMEEIHLGKAVFHTIRLP